MDNSIGWAKVYQKKFHIHLPSMIGAKFEWYTKVQIKWYYRVVNVSYKKSILKKKPNFLVFKGKIAVLNNNYTEMLNINNFTLKWTKP